MFSDGSEEIWLAHFKCHHSSLFPAVCFSTRTGGEAQYNLVFPHQKKNGWHNLQETSTVYSPLTPAPQPSLYLLDIKLSFLSISLSQACSAFSFSFFFLNFLLFLTRTAVSAFTLVQKRNQEDATMFGDACSFWRACSCLRGEKGRRLWDHHKDMASVSFPPARGADASRLGFRTKWQRFRPILLIPRWIRGNLALIHADWNNVYNLKEEDAEFYRIRRNHLWLVAL